MQRKVPRDKQSKKTLLLRLKTGNCMFWLDWRIGPLGRETKSLTGMLKFRREQERGVMLLPTARERTT
jgi:hypothetical protein